MKILISFVNTINKSSYYQNVGLSQLALLDTESNHIFFIDTGKVDDVGFLGLSSDKLHAYVVSQSGTTPSLIKIRKKDLKIVLIKQTNKIKDPHSLLFTDNQLYVVSTGTNSVERFSFDLDYIDTFWKHPNTNATIDEVHMNSIFKYGNDIYVSCFGRKKSKFWSSATEGYLINTESNKILFKNINHPHSANYFGSDIYYCESSMGKVFKNKKELFRRKKSYLRGLQVIDNKLVVAVSGGRIRSKSTKKLLNPAEKGKYVAKTGVIVVNVINKKTEFYDFSSFFKEIYDLLILGEDEFKLNLGVVGIYNLKAKDKIIENRLVSYLFFEKEKLERHNMLLEKKHEEFRKSLFYPPFIFLKRLKK